MQQSIVRAAIGDDLATLKLLVGNQRFNNDGLFDQSMFSWTPLHFAAREGHLDVCRFLIDKGVEIRWRDSDGNSALNLAVESHNVGVVRLLLSAGASVESVVIRKDVTNVTNNQILRSWPLIGDCVDAEAIDLTEELVAAGCDVDEIDNVGNAPLLKATFIGERNRLKLVETLLMCGAKVDNIDWQRIGHSTEPIAVAMLLNEGADHLPVEKVNAVTSTMLEDAKERLSSLRECWIEQKKLLQRQQFERREMFLWQQRGYRELFLELCLVFCKVFPALVVVGIADQYDEAFREISFGKKFEMAAKIKKMNG